MSAKSKITSARMPNLARLQRQAHAAFHDGDVSRTERLCADILAHQPDHFEALHLLGLLNLQRRRMAEALHFLGAAVKADPASSDAMSNLGLALHGSGRFDQAIARFQNALELAPDHPEILCNLANAYLELGRLEAALAGYDAALATSPNHVGALVNRGNTLLRLNQPAMAIASYDTALVAMPGHAQILTNRGHALRRLDRPAEALADFEAAMAAAPDFAEAHFEAAMTHLTLGDFDTGWRHYEWRWNTGAFAKARKPFRAPPWLGKEPVAGKTILLHAEQGFGDTIQFIRYAPLLAEQGAKVICEVQPELQPLLAGIAGVTVFASGGSRPAFDLHAPLLSLPLAFGTQPDTIPAAMPYLAASPDRLTRWRETLPPGERRVGLVWSGSSTHKNDSNRSIALSRLAPVFHELSQDPSLQAVSLQTEMRAADRDALRDWPSLHHLGDAISDFTDTAAILSLLDVVVTVDTAVAHLAGALGKPVLILLPYAADFRWMRSRNDTPWYPSAKLLRQPAFGDWDSVIAGLGEEVRRKLSGLR